MDVELTAEQLAIHERIERGDALSAQDLISLMTDLFHEGYGDEVEIDFERIGITWAQFPGHLYANFYVYQYATGIAASFIRSIKVQSWAEDADATADITAGAGVGSVASRGTWQSSP